MLQKIFLTGLRWLWVSVTVILLDQISKYAALRRLVPYEAYPVMPSFNLTLAYNKGAAFSFLDAASGWQMPLFSLLAVIVSLAILIYLSRISYRQRLVSFALALIVGGALGNFIDRMVYGHVIDFLDFYISYLHWPVFNLADSAICVGAFLLMVDMVFLKNSGNGRGNDSA